jgi:hypothetical protein
MAARVPAPHLEIEGLTNAASLEESIEKRVDDIEMIGEEEAAGFQPAVPSEVTPGMRYLHCSRTIHQLVTDRNRAVGLYLAVASLLWTGSSALLNADPTRLRHLMVPMELVQRWCLPGTFGILAVLAFFVGFLLIRTRVGLIYEVAKMNILLGLPIGRVKRVNLLSLFFIQHLLISLAGGTSGGLLAFHWLVHRGWGGERALAYSGLIGMGLSGLLVLLYIVTVRHVTADAKLRDRTGA